jgi:uncharacterized protein DUF4333
MLEAGLVTSLGAGAVGSSIGAAAQRTSVAVCGLLMAALCACSYGAIITVTPDYAQLEQELKETYSEKLGTTVDRVKCPRLGEIQIPRSFNCDAYVGPRHFSVSVEYKSDSNFQTTSSTSISSGVFVNVAKLQGDIQSDIHQRVGLTVQADCGPEKYKVVDVGDTFQCTVLNTSNNHRASIDAKVTDKDGGVDFHVDASAL